MLDSSKLKEFADNNFEEWGLLALYRHKEILLNSSSTQSRDLITLRKMPFEYIEIGENTGNQVSFFTNVFYPSQNKFQFLIRISFVDQLV